ncbi:glycosyltransferase family 4 protein [Streptomyces sp. RerS4]|uniref:glycosyltransferase family 4 protein n=1 Tax=Streptomyces sp. RerS4 TaxID=2942449 RepID=UPI00201C4001|nr:glycosyltransferase family 4 protein [Streptomyces sp. RerS4]UQX04552.1 glycosyltransferase family 4 protein [Streptomyces sp. RerS4]
MPTVGYFPYTDTTCSVEARWLSEHVPVTVRLATDAPSLNGGPPALPTFERLVGALADFVALPAVVAEGPGGFLWAALLRAHGFAGTATVLPYLNPRCWYDIGAIALYRRFAAPQDRVFLGSTPSAGLYAARGLQVTVGEPYGIDDGLFGLRPGAARTREELSIPPGRMLLFAGRSQPDKDLYRLLRVGLKARVLFPDLQVVIASHLVDHDYLAAARRELGRDCGVHLVLDPTPEQLADLYNVADVFVTASTSHFETFGRAPAEALACGTPAIAPRYDGFAEVLAQVGGTLVDVEADPETGRPHVEEELLLRAVYDVLSAPRPPRREEVSATARRRFGRSATIGLLSHLAGDVPRAAMFGRPPVAPAGVALPAAWHAPLAEIANRDAADALRWFWDACDHARFGAYDDEFAAGVRRALCVPPQRDDEGREPCR